jgi:hypothetical protein
MPALAPDDLDRAAFALVHRGELPTPEPAHVPLPDRQPATRPDPHFDRIATMAPVAKTVDQLIREAGIATGHAPTSNNPLGLPGRLRRLLPVPRDITVPPSHILYIAKHVMRQRGWQNRPYRLHDLRGRVCVCGAIIAARNLGYGADWAIDRAAGHVLAELRRRGWTGLIGPWNRHPERTADDALALLIAARHAAANAGE